MIATKYGAAGSRSYHFVLADDEIRLQLSNNGTDFRNRTSSGAGLQAGEWTHVAVVYDASAGTIDFYADGSFVSQGTGTYNSIFDSTADFVIGATESPAAWFTGGIANVVLFDAKRTSNEIAASYADRDQDLSVASDIIAQWFFDEGSTATAIVNTQGDSGRNLTPYDGGDVAFANLRNGTADDGEQVEVKYNRLFEGRIREMIERWHPGSPESDRNRELALKFESLSPEVVGS